MEFKKWQKIQQFHNIRKDINKLVDYQRSIGEDPKFPVVTYRGKVKLDGTNAAIRVIDGEVCAQSRSRMITPDDDNYGFATFVEGIKDWVLHLFGDFTSEVTIYGEWCGKGIQKRCSVSNCDKMFVIFALEIGSMRLQDPDLMSTALRKSSFDKFPDNVHILPWYGDKITVDYSCEESIDSAVNIMCEAVAEVEKCDPWVKDVFGHEGLGEGIVYYPVEVDFGCLKKDADLMFKAKGEEHKNVTQLKPVIKDVEKVASVAAFVDKFVTDNRLEQGIVELGLTDPSVKDTGNFLKWFGVDVKSESEDELEAAGLKWSDVSKEVGVAARNWFFKRIQ